MTTGDSHIVSNRQHRLSDQVLANTIEPVRLVQKRDVFKTDRRRMPKHRFCMLERWICHKRFGGRGPDTKEVHAAIAKTAINQVGRVNLATGTLEFGRDVSFTATRFPHDGWHLIAFGVDQRPRAFPRRTVKVEWLSSVSWARTAKDVCNCSWHVIMMPDASPARDESN